MAPKSPKMGVSDWLLRNSNTRKSDFLVLKSEKHEKEPGKLGLKKGARSCVHFFLQQVVPLEKCEGIVSSIL